MHFSQRDVVCGATALPTTYRVDTYINEVETLSLILVFRHLKDRQQQILPSLIKRLFVQRLATLTSCVTIITVVFDDLVR